MGCGSSQIDPGTTAVDQRPTSKPQSQSNSAITDKNKPVSATDSNANRSDTHTNNPVPRSIAFTVDLDGQQTRNKLIGPPPPRLKRLDPLNVPTLTAEQLAEKQRQADEKREAALKRKKSASFKASRRRQAILDAQRFDQELQQKEKQDKIEESLASAGKTREAKLQKIQEKQKLREDRARRAREKVRKLNDLDNDLDLEMEKDDDYNADDVDSWLEGDNNNGPINNNNDVISADSGERIYNGRTSPKKRFHANESTIRRGASANTIDSFDNAYNRKPPSASRLPTLEAGPDSSRDDFFDS